MKVLIPMRGQSSEWAVISDMSRAQIDDMRADGIDVGIIENTIPVWVADAGMMHLWWFLQDVWNLRNPMRGKP